MAQVRRERLAQLTSLPAGAGLEIGPLADPLVLRSERDVRYLDVFDQHGLREHYRDDAGVDCDAIPVIDFPLVTDSGVVTLAEAAKEGAPYAFVVACHVIEHVPDVVAWLRDIAQLLTDDGVLVLVVPDRRHCFDYYRQQTSVGQMLQAAEDRDRTPSIRAVYDHFRTAVSVSCVETWTGLSPGELASARLYPLEATLAAVERARSGQYVDSHVWTFTPDVFVDQLTELAVLGLCDFAIEALLPTPHEALEFYAVLRRMDPAADDGTRQALVERSRDRACAALVGAPHPPDLARAAEHEHARQLEAQVEGLSCQVQALSCQVQDVHAELVAARNEVVQVKGSERWRVGGVLVTPVSRAARQWRRVARRRHREGRGG